MFISRSRRGAIASLMVGFLGFSPLGRAADMGTAFTYQGNLENPPGTPVTDTCDFRFGLFDAALGGAQRGTSPQTKTGVAVAGGVFLIDALDFGAVGIDGTARWLAIEVQCTGDPGFTLLSPRVNLSPVPHALALPGLYTQQSGVSPNIIGGNTSNIVTSGVVGATISGGGGSGLANSASGSYSTIGGGLDNSVESYCSTVGGGNENIASGQFFSTVAGGFRNSATDASSTVGGGTTNIASNALATVSGGGGNTASSYGSTVGGGADNTASGAYSTVVGGASNAASGRYSTGVGGLSNQALGDFSFAAGRRAKVRDGGAAGDPGTCGSSFTCGDEGTFVWADSTDADFTSTGPNQFLIRASSGVGIGTNAPMAPAEVVGAYVQERGQVVVRHSPATAAYGWWGAGTNSVVFGANNIAASGGIEFRLGTGATTNQIMLVQPDGRVSINRNGASHPLQVGVNSTNGNGAHVTAGGIWTNGSDRNSKENFQAIDHDEILSKVAGLPITRWKYKGEDDSIHHIGPVAQDFHAAFGLGGSDTHIGTLDADGVALAAIQGLHHIVQEKDCEIEGLGSEISNLKSEISELKALVSKLARQQNEGGR